MPQDFSVDLFDSRLAEPRENREDLKDRFDSEVVSFQGQIPERPNEGYQELDTLELLDEFAPSVLDMNAVARNYDTYEVVGPALPEISVAGACGHGFRFPGLAVSVFEKFSQVFDQK